jgi:hypothetical protein
MDMVGLVGGTNTSGPSLLALVDWILGGTPVLHRNILWISIGTHSRILPQCRTSLVRGATTGSRPHQQSWTSLSLHRGPSPFHFLPTERNVTCSHKRGDLVMTTRSLRPLVWAQGPARRRIWRFETSSMKSSGPCQKLEGGQCWGYTLILLNPPSHVLSDFVVTVSSI